MPDTTPRTKGSILFQAVRAFSFPATIVPCVLGAMLALLAAPNNSTWWLMPFILLSVVCLQAAANVTTDYDDYNAGVDREETLGGSRVLVQKLLEPKAMLRFGLMLFALAFIIAIPIIYTRGLTILLIGVIGILGGFFYTAKPFSFKYHALGDIIIFILFGPGIVAGTFYALTGMFSWNLVYIAVPVGLLIVGILHANNFRDIVHDRQANIKTLATIFGGGFAKGQYVFLVAGAYAAVVVLVLLKFLPIWSLLVFLSLPLGIKNLNAIKGVQIEDTSKIGMLDAHTAQLTLVFGLLLSISIIITKFTA